MNDQECSCVPVEQARAVSDAEYGAPSWTRGQASYTTDTVTREWLFKLRDSHTGALRMVQVTAVCGKSLSQDKPDITVNVDSKNYSVEVNRSVSVCGQPCSYSWELNGHTFQLAVYRTPEQKRNDLFLLVDDREATPNHANASFWFKRYVLLAIGGILCLVVAVFIALLASRMPVGENKDHDVRIWSYRRLILLLSLLSFVIGLFHLIFGCLGVFKYGLATVEPGAYTRCRHRTSPWQVAAHQPYPRYTSIEEIRTYTAAEIAA